MYTMHCGATSYYADRKKSKIPKTQTIRYPAQKFVILHKNIPIVINLKNFLQDSERQIERSEYFLNKFGIDANGMSFIDTYTLDRVIQGNKHRHFIYSKIIHAQLNTMTVNKQWGLGSDLCPVCHQGKEDW